MSQRIASETEEWRGEDQNGPEIDPDNIGILRAANADLRTSYKELLKKNLLRKTLKNN